MQTALDIEGCKIILDRTSQVLSIDLKETGSVRRLLATLPTASADAKLLSAAALIQKAKQFDDGLYAAIELLCQNGSESFAGKSKWLKSVCQGSLPYSKAEEEATALLYSACTLSEIDLQMQMPDELIEISNEIIEKFNNNPALSKPISFYTWSHALEQIFRQDRLLQTPLKGAQIARLISVLREDLESRNAYLNYIDLIGKLTNPFVGTSLSRFLLSGQEQPEAQEEYYFFPPSLSPEYNLQRKLFGNSDPPPNFSLINEIIKRVQNGDLNLQPDNQSGWYDYCIWAIEPLVIPEKMDEWKRVKFSSPYKELLLELFKGAYALTRETHVKSFSGSYGSSAGMFAPKIRIAPNLTVEPLPTLYMRRAFSYRLIKEALCSCFSENTLRNTRTLRQDGAQAESIYDGIERMENLFIAAHSIACDELGMESFGISDSYDLATAKNNFKRWVADIQYDQDLGADSRMMVPLYFDRAVQKLKCWVFLGWIEHDISVGYQQPPGLVSFDHSAYVNPMLAKIPPGIPMYEEARRAPEIIFTPSNYKSFYPVTAELHVKKLLNREEFRGLCNSFLSAAKILQEL